MPFDQNTGTKLPTIGLLYLDHVLRFFDRSNFKGWPNKIETVVYHWGNDAERFIEEVKQKKIDVLIGNIPATAYETFREIARALPQVQFIPSMDSQFANKSKENVTHFCEKYQLPIPKTRIFYDRDEGNAFLESTHYPKIIKRSYGPSNYGGYFVHKVDSKEEALGLMNERRYYPLYIQDFVPMKADIRVMLIGHKPVCAFWRRPPEGEWLTNTSQGGSMDYMNVPGEALEIAVRASKAANAEYWACDIAVSHDDQYSILECATAFAAFPYIRDWIGQYLMWKLSAGRLACPNVPMYNWEELGKMSSTVLRRMRHITFSQAQDTQAMTDTGETFNALDDDGYPIIDTHSRYHDSPYNEEWPSEAWNFQGNNRTATLASRSPVNQDRLAKDPLIHFNQANALLDTGIEDVPTPREITRKQAELPNPVEQSPGSKDLSMTEHRLIELLASTRGVSKKLAQTVLKQLGLQGVIDALQHNPKKLTEEKNIKARRLAHIMKSWENHLKTC